MNWKKYLPIIGILIFVYLFMKIGVKEAIIEVSKADPFFLFIAFLALILMLVVQTFKWFLIAIKQEIKIPFWDAFKINLISNFYGFITPSKLGTVIRADYLRKYPNSNLGKGLCNFVVDKILDITSLFFIVIIFSSIFLIGLKKGFIFPIEIIITLFLVLVLLTIIFLDKDRSKFFLRIFYRKFLSENIKKKAKLTFENFYDKMPRKRYFILFFIVNMVNWTIIYLMTFFIGKALGIDLPYFIYLAILPIGTLVTLIPISINGLGTREFILINLFALFGFSATKVFSMSIISLLFAWILPSLVASYFILKDRG